MLNASARASTRNRSVIPKIRLSATSTFTVPGPRRELRPTSPNVPVGLGTKAAGLIHCTHGEDLQPWVAEYTSAIT